MVKCPYLKNEDSSTFLCNIVDLLFVKMYNTSSLQISLRKVELKRSIVRTREYFIEKVIYTVRFMHHKMSGLSSASL